MYSRLKHATLSSVGKLQNRCDVVALRLEVIPQVQGRRVESSSYIIKEALKKQKLVLVGQWLFPTPEVCSSNPVFGNFIFYQHY